MADTGTVTVREIQNAASSGTSLRGRIPAIPASHLLGLQALFEYPRQWHLGDGGRLVFSPGTPVDDGAAFAIDADGVSLALRLDDSPDDTDPGMHWSDYQGRSRILAWSLAHEARLARLSEALGMALVPVLSTPADAAAGIEVANPPSAGTDSVWLAFRVDEPDLEGGIPPVPCRGTLRLPMSCLPALLTRAGDPYGEDPPIPLGRWPQLRTPVVLAFAGPTVPLAEWRGAAPGSVIVAGRVSAPPSVHATACGRSWPLAATAQGWRIDGEPESTPSLQENPMTSNDDDSRPEVEAASGHAGVEQLSVQLRFDLGQVELTVAELSALQPGYVFPLGGQLEGANVAIRANGRQVGRGEVVAVGDSLGVRLLAWS